MFKSLSTNLTGIMAYQQSLNNIANNVSNVNTAGFRGRTVSFSDLIYRELRDRRMHVSPIEGELEPQNGRGVRVSSSTTSFVQGSLAQTDRALDFGIQGDGFFRLVRPDGSFAYTRSGSFNIDSTGSIVTSHGDYLDLPFNISELLGEGEDAELPPGELVVNPEGVAFWDDGGDEPVLLGQIQLYKFINTAGLISDNGLRFTETETSGAAIEGAPGEEGFGIIRQRFIELSNLNLGEEMVNMLIAQRSLQSNIRALMTSDELWAYTLQVRG